MAIFMNGQSQAIRIPKDFRLNGTTCEITRKGKTLIIQEKQMLTWRQFFQVYRGAPEFEIERNHGIGRKIEL